MSRRSWFIRCARVEKPGVGVVHLHRSWWTPWRVSAMWFQPPQRSVMYRVPESAWDEFFAVTSFEQAMALVRGAATAEVS